MTAVAITTSLCKEIDPVLNKSCRCIIGCLMPTNINSLHLLSGIARPDIRRNTASRRERTRQAMDQRHPLYDQTPACSRLKSRKSFLATTKPLAVDAASSRIRLWQGRLANDPTATNMEISQAEELPPGLDEPWKQWRCLNRLRTGVGRCKASMQRWGYSTDPADCACEHSSQTMEHLLECSSLGPTKCTARDLAEFTKRARAWMMFRAQVV